MNRTREFMSIERDIVYYM